LQKSHELDNCGRVATRIEDDDTRIERFQPASLGIHTLMQLRKREALIAAHKGVSIGFAGVNHAELW